MNQYQSKVPTSLDGWAGCSRAMMQTSIPPLAFTVLSLLLIVSISFGQRFPSTDYGARQAEQTARHLLKNNRFIEAISFLRSEIELLPEDGRKFPLYELLIDALLSNGNLDQAQATIAEAEKHIKWNWEYRDLDRLKRRHSAMQDLLSDSILVAEKVKVGLIDSLAAPPMEKSPGATILVTNSFFEADLRMIMSDLSMETGIPILWDPTLEGLVTYEAVEKPLDEVLSAVLLPMGFTFSYDKGAYYVGSVRPGDPAFNLLSETKVVTLANIGATEAIRSLSESYHPYVKASEASNFVCITAPPMYVERISTDLEKLDKPPTQISIEVVVAEISKTALRKIGMDWTVLQDNEILSPWSIVTDHTNIDNGTFKGSYTRNGYRIGNYYLSELKLELDALVQSGDAKIRANPRITTMHGRTADIGITRDQYFVIQTGGTGTQQQYNTLQAVSSGIRLQITPFASKSGEITVNLRPEVGDVVGSGTEGLPEINTRSANTSILVLDGETFALGGLNVEQEKVTQKKIPLLGEIPLLGYLFRYDEREMRDTEIVIFITPRLLER